MLTDRPDAMDHPARRRGGHEEGDRNRPDMRLRLYMLVVTLMCGLVSATTPVRAGNGPDLAEVLRLEEVIVVLHEEGLAYGAALDRDMLDGLGGAFWTREVARIYAKDQMGDTMRGALRDGLSENQVAGSVAFFETARGQRILSLENAARRAMSDPGIEQIAFDTYGALKGSDNPRLALVARLIVANDLVERNVAGALDANYYFLLGLVDGGASKLSEAQITAEVWSQEDETRASTKEWLFGFMLMAYSPLSDADLEAYIAYSETAAGQALNAALFDGFGSMYRGISHALGMLMAETEKSSDL